MPSITGSRRRRTEWRPANLRGPDHAGCISPGRPILIEVADDGRGLDCDRILVKARQKGLVEDGARLSESDTFRLILEPGFSTADQVSELSGRGVGMDVVRKQVEKLRGRIEIRSQAGQGDIPVEVAANPGPHRWSGGDHRGPAVYRAAVCRWEMFRPAADAMFTVQNRQEMALVRGRLFPVLRLYKRFGLVPGPKTRRRPC